MSEPMLSDFDVLIIGAGAAGLAAGARLAQSPVSFQIIEARPRIGGRAFTDHASGYPLDRGCGWLHSAGHNVWRGIAEAAGFDIDKTLPDWGRQALDLGFSREEQQAFGEAFERFEQKWHEAAQTGHDESAAHFFEPGNRWNPLIDAISTYMSGAGLKHISALDLCHYRDSEINWRIRDGYGTAIRSFGAKLPVTLSCAVSEIDHSGANIRVETSSGTLTARAVIVTIPPSLFVSGAVRFRPDLPQKQEAAGGLPLGVANKLFIAVDDPDDLPSEGHLFGRIDRVQTASYHLRPFGRPVIEAYFGGSLALELEQAGADAFFAFACGELAGLFGESIRKRLRFVLATGWARDPFSLGSYSYARPGCADARQKMARSVDNRLFFAGEACSPHYFSTAHGAHESGAATAEEALAALSPKVRTKAV